VEGGAEASRSLRTIGGRMSGTSSLAPVMSIIGEDWSSTMQENIRQGNLDLPEMHPSTKAIRRYYGHQGPRLVRDGQLLHSIRVLSDGGNFTEVGSDDRVAGLLQRGGQNTDNRGRVFTLRPHPFIVVSDEMIDDAENLIADYVMEGANA
jgi:phage gpG-like protein